VTATKDETHSKPAKDDDGVAKAASGSSEPALAFGGVGSTAGASMRGEYERQMVEIRRGFELNGDGLKAARARSALVDGFVMRLWDAEVKAEPGLVKGVTLTAVGGYGRGMMFPYSDVDLLVCVEKNRAGMAKDAVRRVSQSLWDCGMQVALSTRMASECERFEVGNAEFGLSLLDLRFVGGDEGLYTKLSEKAVARMRQKDAKALCAEMASLTRERHSKYGNTLFHLEPNIKDCPGGMRDANVCGWLQGLRGGHGLGAEFEEAVGFLAAVRCFLHYRHERDDNVLDWLAQDAAAERHIGLGAGRGSAFGSAKISAAYWMRAYFRYARVVERRLLREAEDAGLKLASDATPKRMKLPTVMGLIWKDGRLELESARKGFDPAQDPDVVLAAFAAMAKTGSRLTAESEERIAEAIPMLSAVLEEGPGLWRRLSEILTGDKAAAALRVMHALGVLELILPEFHGIDALVIRDAYHRYTVDEHTFVLIDTLHGLAAEPAKGAPEWRVKLGTMIRELQNPGLLYLAALLHDTGKGRASDKHAEASAQMARGVLKRLEMDAYDSDLVMRLIEAHLEMSAALRRDIFDVETVHVFAGKVQTHELLRMLTLFTYADIDAVHPDAMTPWKAENLWRLSMATANQLDRNVDEERVHAVGSGEGRRGPCAPAAEKRDKVARVLALMPGREREVEGFLEGFPERYVNTRTPEVMRQHFEMSRRLAEEPFQIAFLHGSSATGAAVSEITLVTKDRPRLFADMAAALAAWGMNVVTADAFANAAGVVVDSFRFTDTFKTLELNESERERFVESVRELVAGRASVEKMLSSRRRGRRKAPKVVTETKVEFDDTASAYSTLLQVIAQDVPGLLRAVSMTLSEMGLNVEVALVDTEGETAIDVFYLTSGGARLRLEQEDELRRRLVEAIEANAL
jgi:[protein-PII] uridylyltransferase